MYNKIKKFEEYKKINESHYDDYYLHEDPIYELTDEKFGPAVTEEELKILFPTEEEYIENVGLDYDDNPKDENGEWYKDKPFYVIADIEVGNIRRGGDNYNEPKWSDADYNIENIQLPLFDNATAEEKAKWSKEKWEIIEKIRKNMLEYGYEKIQDDDDLFLDAEDDAKYGHYDYR